MFCYAVIQQYCSYMLCFAVVQFLSVRCASHWWTEDIVKLVVRPGSLITLVHFQPRAPIPNFSVGTKYTGCEKLAIFDGNKCFIP